MYLKVGVLLPREDGLVREVRNKEHVLALLKGERGRLAEDGEHDLHLSLLVQPQDIPVLGHAVDLLLDYDWTGQLVAVGREGSALLQVLLVDHYNYYRSVTEWKIIRVLGRAGL